MNAIFYRYVKTFIIRWSVWWSVRNFYRYDDRWFDRYETFIGMMFWSYKNFYRYDWSVRWWSSWSVRNFYRYGTFIGMKLLSVQKLLSVRNFYQYETYIGETQGAPRWCKGHPGNPKRHPSNPKRHPTEKKNQKGHPGLFLPNLYRWNFYRYKTIKLFFIGTMAFKLLSVQWLMNEWMNGWMNEWMNESVQWL